MSDRVRSVSRRVGVVVGHILVYVLIWAGLALLIAAAGIRFYWGNISVGQMLLNLVSVETDGGGGSLVWTGILAVGVAPLLITLLIALWRHMRHRKRRISGEGMPTRRKQWIMRSVSTLLVSAVVVGGTTSFATTVGMGDYIKAGKSAYDVDDFYAAPTVTGDSGKNNLVLIYLESGEATLEDDQLFEKDAFIPLKAATAAEEGWQSVDNLQQYKGGGWTMAGLASTQCGVPLKGAGFGADSGSSTAVDEDADTYLGGITCLGDVLDGQGYTSVFMGGASSSFAAKDTFLTSHGYSEVKGLADWRDAGEPEENFRPDWGLSDERLMANAKDKVDELHAEAETTGQPFNLSVLTLDTHEPVHVYDYCNVDTQERVTSVFDCSMTQVAGFVNHMKDMGYLEDTAVVIMGDHLKHMSAGDAFHEQLDFHENRTIFNRIWVPGQDKTIAQRPGTDQLSMFPTILEAAGLTLQDSQAGLGVSAFAPGIPADSAQALDPGAYGELLDSNSPLFYAQAWAGKVDAQ
ncbi:LTA synthase family protein [Arthrobacter gengyunqii]|uniref:LTA synthase family protein n=1 Tax=Arthrobacter gengyunqii TaxID=2886940 RepID=A0A9X1M4W4_9MICC|nr:LTA synthase family protein [Arthrobacter gengyunqii]MCC3270855.1 LTA synthase family protein [Arthrobacter gengyunqii]UOY96454.1 LTA synthase family protein [Arthrobacter gengyunqii]